MICEIRHSDCSWGVVYLSKYIEEIMSYPDLTKEETKKLITEKKQGNLYARDLLIKHSLKTVINLANEFQEDINLDVDELINIGALGLIEAIDRCQGCIDLGCKKCFYISIRENLNNYLHTLNNQGENLYGSYQQLEEKTIPYKDEVIATGSESIEDIACVNVMLENIKLQQPAKQYVKKKVIKKF